MPNLPTLLTFAAQAIQHSSRATGILPDWAVLCSSSGCLGMAVPCLVYAICLLHWSAHPPWHGLSPCDSLMLVRHVALAAAVATALLVAKAQARTNSLVLLHILLPVRQQTARTCSPLL